MRTRILVLASVVLILVGVGIFWYQYRRIHPRVAVIEYSYERKLPVLSSEDRLLLPNGMMHMFMFGSDIQVEDGKSLVVVLNGEQWQEYVVTYYSTGTVDSIKQEYLNFIRDAHWTLFPGQAELPAGSLSATNGNSRLFVAITPNIYGAQVQVTLMYPIVKPMP